MRFFPLNKINQYRKASSKDIPDIVDLKFPSELKDGGDDAKNEILVFVLDDDPDFMQVLNTHLLQFSFEKNHLIYHFKVKNYATGRSCIKDLAEEPHVILMNYHINEGLKNVLTGKPLLDAILEVRPGQKIVVSNNLEGDLKGTLVLRGLRDKIRQDKESLRELERYLQDLV